MGIGSEVRGGASLSSGSVRMEARCRGGGPRILQGVCWTPARAAVNIGSRGGCRAAARKSRFVLQHPCLRLRCDELLCGFTAIPRGRGKGKGGPEACVVSLGGAGSLEPRPCSQTLLPGLLTLPALGPHTHPQFSRNSSGTCYLSAQSLRGRPGRRGGTCWNLHPPELNETRSEISKIHF